MRLLHHGWNQNSHCRFFSLSYMCIYIYEKKINEINSMLTNALCVPYIYRLTFLDMILEKSNKKLYQETIFPPYVVNLWIHKALFKPESLLSFPALTVGSP